jgi:3-oxoacyl-[acyl-carrier protein] reductase
LEGRVALVTGSARGIGAAIAERLARDGAAVAINYLNSKEHAEAVAEQIRKAGGNAAVIQADIGDPAQARSLVESAVGELGRLDILVNNAGITMMAPIESIDPEQIRLQLTVNVEGPIFTVQAARGYLPSEGGRVINITGNVQLHPVPGTSVYAAAKGAIDALTRAWAKELGPRGVTVNAVGPGPKATEAFEAVSNHDLTNLFVSRTPLGPDRRPVRHRQRGSLPGLA